MGCFQSYTKWQQEQITISTISQNLGYNNYNYKIPLKVFHRYFPFISLTKAELIECLNKLQISFHNPFYSMFIISHYELKYIKTLDFYNKYPQVLEKKSYSVKKLSTLAIILGKGKLSSKAKSLFDIYNFNDNLILNEKDLGLMIENICDVSILCLPNYAEMHKAEIGETTKIVKDHYCALKIKYCEYFKELIFIIKGQGEFTKERFVKELEDPDVGILLDDQRLRAFIADQYNNKSAIQNNTRDR
ncbi:hypothetical protein SteCoe_13711 [Stentor coeruleus]|uniref:Uncharacterized protein n=1 Tax=Stentor coeruleus TaxID=5963 RepID=A0A1R2C7S5_9CILI|nr:hypothetical protein SteCoe_13711 [Stentor coeruleus]